MPDDHIELLTWVGERRGERVVAAAWADFHRFLVGWEPDHWQIHRYTRRMTRTALDRL